MKLSHLKQLVGYFSDFSKISAIYRVYDTVIKIVFDRDDAIYFDMTRGNSAIYTSSEFVRTKVYNAPFDVVLAKRFNRCTITNVSLVEGDKILRFATVIKGAYKEVKTYLQFEFTGKYTNVIILGEEETTLEALRHVDIFSSYREVQVGVKLLPLKQAPYKAKDYPINDIKEFLFSVYKQRNEQKLTSLKKQKLLFLQKKFDRLQKIFNALASQEELKNRAREKEMQGNLVLANIHLVKPYEKCLHVKDYNGDDVEIVLDELFSSAPEIARHFFKVSKKAKQKLQKLHIERSSLEQKMEFLRHYMHTTQQAGSVAEINLLFPEKKQKKKIKQDESIEQFVISGYKVMLGKSERGNILLLKKARAKDIWLHLKDRPSAHVIITTDRQSLPKDIIYEAAKLCVNFSVFEKGRYLVDYTNRREVKVQEGAHVLYNKYQTIEVDTK